MLGVKHGFSIIVWYHKKWQPIVGYWVCCELIVSFPVSTKIFFSAGSYDPERRPLIRHLLDDPMGRVENPANFFTPLDSPNHSEGEGDDGHTDIGISAGSVEDPGSKIPVMARLTPARVCVIFHCYFTFPQNSVKIYGKFNFNYCQKFQFSAKFNVNHWQI